MIRSIIYAILLGIGMAACLSQHEDEVETETETERPATTAEAELSDIESKPEPASFMIQKGEVGDMEIGALIDSIRNQVPAGYTLTDTVLLLEGTQAAAYLLKPNNHNKGLIIEQLCNPSCRVWRINVQHPDFKTPKGIGVGSKYSEVQRYYPISSIELADGGLVALSEQGGMTFVLDTSQIPKSEIASLTPQTVPANTLVNGILIY